MQLIPNATKAWKFLSVQVIALVGLFDVVHQMLPAVQQYIPTAWLGYINAAGAAVAIVARIIQQNNLRAEAPDSPCVPDPAVAAAPAAPPVPSSSQKDLL